MTTNDSQNHDYPSLLVDLSTNHVAEAGSHWVTIDELREQYPAFKNEYATGHWMLTRYEDILAAYKDYKTFSNESMVPLVPNPTFRFLPSMSDPPIHTEYRKLLTRLLSPAGIAKHQDEISNIAKTLIEGFVDEKRCDFLTAFGDEFSSRVLMNQLGLPQEDAEFVRNCVHKMAGQASAGTGDSDAMQTGWSELSSYWSDLITDRRRNPRDPDDDFVTFLTQASLSTGPLPEADMLDLLVTLAQGGLDTSKTQLGWSIYHLARNEDDRKRVVEDPTLVPNAVEEFLRAYPIISMARKLTKDIEFQGCPMKKGEMVLLSTQAACRDPRKFDDADQVVIDRFPNQHVAFGASRHRCPGANLARAELVTAIVEFHKQIPDYWIDSEEPLMATGGQISLKTLPLAWS